MKVPDNPYAIFVRCDGAMDYDRYNTGGIGYVIEFPDFVELENVTEVIGRFEGANIERLEIEALISGMEGLIELYKYESKKLSNINTVVFITDRYALNDTDRTNPFKIKEWRKNKWHNHEGKAIKNHDLLDKLDKTRTRLHKISYSRINIEHRRRKENKVADKLAKEGKKQPVKNESIATKGLKVGVRKFKGAEVIYKTLKSESEYHIHIYRKTPVNDQWEVGVEICEGELLGKKMKIYTDDELAAQLQRRHDYLVVLKKIYTHHVLIFEQIKDLSKK